MDVNEKLIKVRLFRNIKQKYVATRLAISERTFRKYEKGEIPIPYEVLIRVADILVVPLEYFISNDDIEVTVPHASSHSPDTNTEEFVGFSFSPNEKNQREKMLQEKDAVIRDLYEKIQLLQRQIKYSKRNI